MEPNSLDLLKAAEQKLKQEQENNPNRAAAIALTNLQTAILWLEKSLSSS